jgi:hypothetical protein
MRRVVLEYVGSVFFATVGFFVLAGVYTLIDTLDLDIDVGGDKGPFLVGILVGLPVGGVLGTILVGKVFLGERGLSVLGILLSLILVTVANYLGLVMMDRFGSRVALILPLVAAAACVLVQNIDARIK